MAEEWGPRVWCRSKSIWGAFEGERPVRLCSVTGCCRPHVAHGWCSRHNRARGEDRPRRAPLARGPEPKALAAVLSRAPILSIAETAWALQADHERFAFRPARAKDHPSRQAWVAANDLWREQVRARRLTAAS